MKKIYRLISISLILCVVAMVFLAIAMIPKHKLRVEIQNEAKLIAKHISDEDKDISALIKTIEAAEDREFEQREWQIMSKESNVWVKGPMLGNKQVQINRKREVRWIELDDK
jgi:uncharacterized protein YacL (UPF0231 family)